MLKAETEVTMLCRFIELLEVMTLDTFGESLARQVSSSEYDIVQYILSSWSALVVNNYTGTMLQYGKAHSHCN